MKVASYTQNSDCPFDIANIDASMKVLDVVSRGIVKVIDSYWCDGETHKTRFHAIGFL